MTESKLPRRINVERLCQHKDRLQGVLAENDMPRLMKLVLELESPITVFLDFRHDESGQAIVTGVVETKFTLNCQRCLRPFTYAVKTELSWAVVKNDERAKQVQQLYDPITVHAAGEFDLLAQLEDEIILNMPIIPMHDNLDDCVKIEQMQGQRGAALDVAPQRKENPFAKLAELKKELKSPKK